MRSPDTSLGGAGASFPDTRQGLGLEELCRRYWKPVYAYLRAAYGRSNEDAKDLTQAFFTRLLDGRALDAYDPARGSFRTYLKVLLRSLVSHEREAAESLKRGGGASVISLDAEALPALEDPRGTDPEELFDRLWRAELAERALDALRESCRRRGLERRFEIYEAYALAPREERPTYAELARRAGVSEDEVRRHLAAARSELKDALRAELDAAGDDGHEILGPRKKA